jgi:hypothetical protein
VYSSKKLSRITNEDVLFFAQHFLELTSYKTVESYKTKMMMSISLCDEFIMLYKHSHSKPEYLQTILEELKKSIKSDYIAKTLLSFSLDDYYKNGLSDDKNINKQYKIIKLIKEELNIADYINKSIEYVQNNITKRRELIDVISNLVSLLNYIQFDNAYLFYVCKEYFENVEKNLNVEDINIFFQENILNINEKFNVYIEIANLPETLNKKFFHENVPIINILDKEEQSKMNAEKKFLTDNNFTILLFRDIEASNPYNSIKKAKAIIDNIDVAYNIFNHTEKILYGKSNLAIDVSNNKKYYFNNHVNPITHQKEISEQTMKKFKDFFTNFIINSDSMDKFNKSLTLHSYALRNRKPENQLIFFWTAFETIAIKKSTTIIDSVISFILPFLLKRYFYENLQYIYNDLLFFKRKIIEKIFETFKLEVNFENFIIVIFFKQDVLEKIFEKLDDLPILRHKIYSMNKDLKTPEDISNKFINHKQTILKQIKRIYRYRNLVIHDNKNIVISSILLSNMHNYFDYIIDEIIEYSYSKHIHNIEEIHLYIEMLLYKHENLLKSEQKINEDNILDLLLLRDYISNNTLDDE